MVSLAIEIRYYRHLRVCRGKKRSGHRSHQSTATHLSPSTDKAFSCLFFAPLVILGSICTAFSVWASFGLLLLGSRSPASCQEALLWPTLWCMFGPSSSRPSTLTSSSTLLAQRSSISGHRTSTTVVALALLSYYVVWTTGRAQEQSLNKVKVVP